MKHNHVGRSSSLRRTVLLTLLCALTVLLGLTPLGLIPLGFINVTVLVIPVAVGTIMLGRKQGLVIALVFGAVSYFIALTRPSSLVSTLMGASPLLAAVMTFLPRLMIPVTSSIVYRLLPQKSPAGKPIAVAAASAVGSLTNTVLYLGLMVWFYQLAGLNSQPVLGLIASVAVIAGLAEAAVAAIVTPAICFAVERSVR